MLIGSSNYLNFFFCIFLTLEPEEQMVLSVHLTDSDKPIEDDTNTKGVR